MNGGVSRRLGITSLTITMGCKRGPVFDHGLLADPKIQDVIASGPHNLRRSVIGNQPVWRGGSHPRGSSECHRPPTGRKPSDSRGPGMHVPRTKSHGPWRQHLAARMGCDVFLFGCVFLRFGCKVSLVSTLCIVIACAL